jgi:sugar lactone lactonase YvrE
MEPVEHVLAAQAELGEGPLWHPLEQVLYFVDITQGNLHRFDPASGQHDVTDLGVVIGAMGVRAEGGFVMATRKGFALRSAEGVLTYIGDPDAGENEQVRFNDGKTDPTGRFWAGKMGGGANNSLYRLDPDHSIQRMVSGVSVSNGLGWSPDRKTFYYTDTPTMVINAYDFDPASGAIANRRVFASVPAGEGSPDGLAVDSQGYVWSARWGGWKVVRYAPDGSVDCEIGLPVSLVTSCAFGGPDLEDLYITSAYVSVPQEKRAAEPMAGDVFRVRTGVKGMPEPLYRG